MESVALPVDDVTFEIGTEASFVEKCLLSSAWTSEDCGGEAICEALVVEPFGTKVTLPLALAKFSNLTLEPFIIDVHNSPSMFSNPLSLEVPSQWHRSRPQNW